MTGPSFCTSCSERVYITAKGRSKTTTLIALIVGFIEPNCFERGRPTQQRGSYPWSQLKRFVCRLLSGNSFPNSYLANAPKCRRFAQARVWSMVCVAWMTLFLSSVRVRYARGILGPSWGRRAFRPLDFQFAVVRAVALGVPTSLGGSH